MTDWFAYVKDNQDKEAAGPIITPFSAIISFVPPEIATIDQEAAKKSLW